MDISNSTGQDTKYKVTGGTGGSGMGPHHHFRAEEAVNWPVIRAGSRIHHDPTPPGLWVVWFVVGNHQVSREVSSPSDQVTLVQAGSNFRAQAG